MSLDYKDLLALTEKSEPLVLKDLLELTELMVKMVLTVLLDRKDQ